MLRYLTVFAALLLLTACAEEAPEAAELLPGRWDLTEARRDNMTTPMLDGLYFVFNEDGVLETNLMGNEGPGMYQLEGGIITTTEVRPPLAYDVVDITDSTLHLRTELQDFRFDFQLARRREKKEL